MRAPRSRTTPRSWRTSASLTAAADKAKRDAAVAAEEAASSAAASWRPAPRRAAAHREPPRQRAAADEAMALRAIKPGRG